MIDDVWNMVIGEVSAWVGWFASWQLFGVSFLYYVMAFAIIGLLLDFIFG